jgi:hypothetical protein
MNIFEHMNAEGDAQCPVCGTSEDKRIALIPITGTNRDDGNIFKSAQVHLDCLNLMLYEHTDPDCRAMIGQAAIYPWKKTAEVPN